MDAAISAFENAVATIHHRLPFVAASGRTQRRQLQMASRLLRAVLQCPTAVVAAGGPGRLIVHLDGRSQAARGRRDEGQVTQAQEAEAVELLEGMRRSKQSLRSLRAQRRGTRWHLAMEVRSQSGQASDPPGEGSAMGIWIRASLFIGRNCFFHWPKVGGEFSMNFIQPTP